jgi:hypothetical protein
MKNFALLALIAAAASSQAAIITQWDFNFGNDANTSTGTLNPVLGSGTAALFGGNTSTFASGDATGGSSDPNVGDDSAWNTTTYAAQGTGDKSRGVEFLVSTAGSQNIMVMFDLRHSNTSSRFIQFQYTTDGATWVDFGAAFEAVSGGDFWYNQRTVDLSTVSAVNDNASFGIRFTPTFAPNTTEYYGATANAASGYATTGTLRYDMVTISGDAVPEPASLIALGAGIAAFAARRRRK